MEITTVPCFLWLSLSAAPAQQLPEKTWLSQALPIRVFGFVLLLIIEKAFHSSADTISGVWLSSTVRIFHWVLRAWTLQRNFLVSLSISTSRTQSKAWEYRTLLFFWRFCPLVFFKQKRWTEISCYIIWSSEDTLWFCQLCALMFCWLISD